MKITKTKLKQLIKEELAKVLNEETPKERAARRAREAQAEMDRMFSDDSDDSDNRPAPTPPAEKPEVAPEVAPTPAKKSAVGTKLTPPQDKKQFLEYLNRYFAAMKKLGPAPRREAYPAGLQGSRLFLDAQSDHAHAGHEIARNHHIKSMRLIKKDDLARGLTKGQIEYVSSNASGNMIVYRRKK